jgi:hypothetical protein
MSKKNNRNPNFYDAGTRNHPGEGVTYKREKQEYVATQKPQKKPQPPGGVKREK